MFNNFLIIFSWFSQLNFCYFFIDFSKIYLIFLFNVISKKAKLNPPTMLPIYIIVSNFELHFMGCPHENESNLHPYKQKTEAKTKTCRCLHLIWQYVVVWHIRWYWQHWVYNGFSFLYFVFFCYHRLATHLVFNFIAVVHIEWHINVIFICQLLGLLVVILDFMTFIPLSTCHVYLTVR